MVNPFTGRRSRRSQVAGFALLLVAAMLLSALTVLGLRWASTSSASKASGPKLGFTRLDQPAPAFSLPSLHGGGTVTLASMAGRPIVLNFWATTCHICTKETPALASVARTVHGKIAFLGIDTADSRGPAIKFADRYDVPYPMAFDPTAKVGAAYRVIGLPITFFLSPSGKKILGENIGALTAARLRTILLDLYRIP
jgi:cytochrome c biogenesis protein CcmG/thiol:disulfide interchange protein DsbE